MRSVEIEASYTPNGQMHPKPMKRHYQVQLDKQGYSDVSPNYTTSPAAGERCRADGETRQ